MSPFTMKQMQRMGLLKSAYAQTGVMAALLLCADSSFALDSYRYLHVTIETPWAIFLFLLLCVFAPFILMAVLVWRYSERQPTAPPVNTPPDSGDPEA